MRAATIKQRVGLWTGWVGVGTDVRVDGLRVLCHPKWGAEGKVVRDLRAATEILVLTKATMPMTTLFAGWPGYATQIQIPRLLRCWVGDDGVRSIPIRVPQLTLYHWRAPTASHAAAQRTLRLAQSCALHPGPKRPRPTSPGSVGGGSATPGLDPVVERMRAHWHGQAPQVALLAPPARAAARQHATDPAAAGRDAVVNAMVRQWAAPVQAPTQPSPAEAAPTSGSRLLDVLHAIGHACPLMDRSSGPTITALATAALSRVADAKRARRGRTRAELAAASLAAFAAANGGADTPTSATALDTLALAYVDARIQGSGGMRQIAPETAAGDVSAVAAALRAHGLDVGPYLGPMTAVYLSKRGAGQRRDVSNALPLLMRWLLSVEPPAGSPDHPIWASRLAQCGYMLRPGVAGALRRGHLTPWGPGYILSWPLPDKTRPGDVCAPEEVVRGPWRVTACGHPDVKRVLDLYRGRCSRPDELLWPEATPRATLK